MLKRNITATDLFSQKEMNIRKTIDLNSWLVIRKPIVL